MTQIYLQKVFCKIYHNNEKLVEDDLNFLVRYQHPDSSAEPYSLMHLKAPRQSKIL